MAPRPPSPVGRAELLAAATREFADHGYAGASTAGIARRAGVTQPLVHHHFGSKLGLWEAVLAELFGSLRQTLEAALAEVAGAPTRERLAYLLRAFIRFSGARPELSRLIQVESSAGGEAFDALFDRWQAPLLRFLEQQLQSAVDEGLLRKVDVRLVYFAVVGISTHPFGVPATARRAYRLDVTRPEVIDRYADFAVELLFSGLLAAPLEAAKPVPGKAPRRGKRG